MGGCVYKHFIETNELKIKCNYSFIKAVNSLIFISEVYKDLESIDYNKLLNEVKYIRIEN